VLVLEIVLLIEEQAPGGGEPGTTMSVSAAILSFMFPLVVFSCFPPVCYSRFQTLCTPFLFFCSFSGYTALVSYFFHWREIGSVFFFFFFFFGD